MKRIVSMFATVVMVLTMMVPVATAGTVFDDVADGSEFASYIHGLYNEGVVGGLGGNYYPLNNVTRAEMAKMAVLGAGIELTEIDGGEHFTDVPRTHSLYPYVETAYAHGIVQGRSAGMYAPDAPVLRQEGMKIVVRSFRFMDTEGYFTEDLTGAPHFNDVPATSEFYGDIETAYNLGIISGYGNGMFGPMDYMRRDQMAKVVYNSMRVANGEDIKEEEGYKIRLGVSTDEVNNDCTSLVQITATIENDNVVDDNYEQPVRFSTNLGTFEDGDDEYTETASEGRAHATLRAACEEGTATIEVTSGALSKSSIQVVFSSDAPRVRKGLGTNSVAGVGTMDIIITDSDLLIDDGTTASFLGTFPQAQYGNATVEVYVRDTDDIPVTGDNVVCSIVEGDGALFAGPTPNASNPTTIQSVTMNAENNGRYTGNYVVLDNASEDTINIQCIDLDTSPSLTVDADLDINNLTMDAWANHDELLTRNQTQVGANTTIVQNVATLIAKINDENGDPVEVNTGTTSHNVVATIVDGADSSSFLLSNTTGFDNNQVDADPLQDADGNVIPGFYVVQFVAGTSEGDVTVEFMDTGAIGIQPTAEVTLSIMNPEFEVYKSAERVGLAGTNADGSTLLVKVVDNDDVALFDETVCVKIVSHAGSTDDAVVSPIGAGACAGAGAQQLDQLLDMVAAPTGFYWAQYTGPTFISKNNTTDLEFYNNVDRTGVDSELATINVQKTATPNQVVDDLELLPIETIIGPGQVVPVVIFAQDDEGYGVECLADTFGLGTGCPGGHYDPADLVVTALNNGTVDPLAEINDDGLGYGAYLTAFVAAVVGGTDGEMQVTATSVTPVQARQKFKIEDATIELELLRDEVITDEGLGALIYMYDQNDDPFYGQAGVTTVNPPSGGNIAVNPSGVEELFQVGSVIAPVFAPTAGSGVYVFSLDTNTDINAGTYNVNVSAVIGRLITDSDSLKVSNPQVEVDCHPDFVVTNNTIVCTVIVRDEDGDPLVVPDDYLRVTTNVGTLINDNLTATAGAKVDTLTDINGDGVFFFTFQGGSIEDSATVTAQLWSQVVAVTPPAGAKLLDSDTFDLDIR